MQFLKNKTLLISLLLTTQSTYYLTLSAAQEGSKENSVSSSQSDQKFDKSFSENAFKNISELLLKNKKTIKQALRDDTTKKKIDNDGKLVHKNFSFLREKLCDFIEEFYAGIDIDKYTESLDYQDIKDSDFFKRWKNYCSEENYSIIFNVLQQNHLPISDADSGSNTEQPSETSSTQSRQSDATIAGSLSTMSSESNATLNITLNDDLDANQQIDHSSTLPQNNSQAGIAFYQAPTVAEERSTKRKHKSKNTKKANKNRRGRLKTRSYHRNASATKSNNTSPYYPSINLNNTKNGKIEGNFPLTSLKNGKTHDDIHLQTIRKQDKLTKNPGKKRSKSRSLVSSNQLKRNNNSPSTSTMVSPNRFNASSIWSINTSIATSSLHDLSPITNNGIAAPNQQPISSLHEMPNLIEHNTDTEDATITTNPNLNHQNHQERDRQNDISTHSPSALIPITNTTDLDVLESDDEDEQKAEVYDNITPGKQTDSSINEIVEEDIGIDNIEISPNDNPKKPNNRNDKNFSLVIIIFSAISVFAGFATLFHKLAEQPTKDTKLSDKAHIKSKKADKT